MKAMLGFLMGVLISFGAMADVTIISQSQLQQWQQSGKEFLLLDTRSPDEFAMGHIKGAVNVEFNRVANAMDTLSGWKDKPVVVYCRSGRRAGIAQQYLELQGFSGLHHLEGDILGWNREGLPLEK